MTAVLLRLEKNILFMNLFGFTSAANISFRYAFLMQFLQFLQIYHFLEKMKNKKSYKHLELHIFFYL